MGRRRLGGAAIAALTLVLTLAGFPALSAPAGQEAPLFEQVGTLSRFPADARAVLGEKLVPRDEKNYPAAEGILGTLIMVPEARQVWQIFFSSAASGSPQQWAAVVRDLDTLEIVKRVDLPALERDTRKLAGGGWTHAVDPAGLRLFLVTENNTEVLEIDLRSFAITHRPLPSKATPFAGAFPIVVGGVTYDAFKDDVLLLFGGPPTLSAANANTFIYTLDVSVPPADQASASGFYRLRSCTAELTSTDGAGDTYSWDILVSEKYLYVPCQRGGNTGEVVRLSRPKALLAVPTADQEPLQPEDVAVGPVYVETAMADPASGRLFLATTRREIWVFEASTMSFVGIVATGSENTGAGTGYGLDRSTGRVFFQSSTFGLGVAEGRFFPVPQARTMGRFAQGQERILSDASTSRIFVLEGWEQTKADQYRIYRTGQAPTPPSPPDPDRNTMDVPEQDGVTESRYFASGSGYGARAFLSKGLSTVAPAPNAGVVTPTAQAIDKSLNPNCGYTDRELVAGRVRKAEYDTGSTAAAAIAFDLDGATKQDLDKPARCDTPIRNPFGGAQVFGGIFKTAPVLDEKTQQPDDPNTPEQETRWGLTPASCSSSEGGDAEDGEGKGTLAAGMDLGPSEVSCPNPGGKLVARATAELAGGVAVGRAFTTATVERGSFGVRSTVESVAQDVNIADGAVTFAEIRSKAVSTSNGRPSKEPMSRHEVVIRGAAINGAEVCDVCKDLSGLVATLNTAVGGKATFRSGKDATTGFDKELKQGSPRGALTAVQKSAARQASDQSLTGDFTTEIPGLEMLVFNDNTEWGRARQLYQFAGVATAATYNVVLRPTGLGLDFDAGAAGFDGTPPLPSDGFGGLALPSSAAAPVAAAPPPPVSLHRGGGSGILTPILAVGRGLRLLFTNPRQIPLLLSAWALFSLPGVLSRRRRLLQGVDAP